MMYRGLFLLMGLLPFSLSAQNSFDIVAVGGVNMAFPILNGGASVVDGVCFGYNGQAQFMLNAEKWQVGAGIEVGSLKGTARRKAIDRTTHYGYTNTRSYPNQPIAAPYYAPQLFVNYKAWLSSNTYLYVGCTGGYMLTGNGLAYDGKGSGWTVGPGVGLAIKITDAISIDISEGWKYAWIRNKNAPDFYFDPYKNYTDPVFVPDNEYNFSFFTTSVGIRFSL